MQNAALKFDGREIVIQRDVTTIGRISENDVSFPQDSNVSRYHAEIERRGGDHWLIDLRSSNGTTVNGNKLAGEIRLSAGDKLVFGGSSQAEFLDTASPVADAADAAEPLDVPGMSLAQSEIGSIGYQAESQVEYAAGHAVQNAVRSAVSGTASGGSSAASSAGAAAASAAPAASSGSTVLVAGAVVGLAVVCAVAAGAFYLTRGSACAARAAITKPETGDTIDRPVEIELKTQDVVCAQRAIFTVDGETVATADAPEFAATLDPKDVPDLADGVDHALQVILIDADGNKIPQAGAIKLVFETRALTKASPTPAPVNANVQPPKQTGRQPSLAQVNEMSQRLIKQFTGGQSYDVSNKQFLEEVLKRTAEYAQEGYSQRAATYREVITVAFVREQNIDAPLGFILAMSRTKFNPAKQGDREGLWQLSTSLINDNKYNGQCPTESLSDPGQNCAAKSAALYLKAIVSSVFDGDPIYSAAAFGKSSQDAGTWNATLPKKRSDVWNTIKTPDEREQLVRFFAAGIVAENPQAFGLTKDRPLSELYRVTLK